MYSSMRSTTQVVVQIVTPDSYLELGLKHLVNEELGWLNNTDQSGEDVVRVVLVDTAFLGSSEKARRWLSENIRKADVYAFMSYSNGSFDRVPHLRLGGPVLEVKRELLRLVTRLVTGSKCGSLGLFSRLTSSEKQLILFLTCGYDVKAIHRSLGLNVKTVYRKRSEVMKKFNLANRKELHTMLRVHDFLQHMKTKEDCGTGGIL
ncbi:LuxR C-terminal-related transcriptional regulator [Klebsiella aerogenes]|uniref:helix-turn-helix transcriptional regulator n=1 Tax=Klebsiella aerogenes TaxID=548 RepID=UPI00254EFD10|nr:LuxR C-terminal-related transcriptional regulator [Klebsiella aerogenes]MDK6932427.1 LuxR C-terminal-related transcriptional regulator [Klebsiella aerogenes]